MRKPRIPSRSCSGIVRHLVGDLEARVLRGHGVVRRREHDAVEAPVAERLLAVAARAAVRGGGRGEHQREDHGEEGEAERRRHVGREPTRRARSRVPHAAQARPARAAGPAGAPPPAGRRPGARRAPQASRRSGRPNSGKRPGPRKLWMRRDPAAGHLEDGQREGPVDAVAGGVVDAEGRAAAGLRREQAGVLALDALPEHPGVDLVRAPQPEREGRHRERRVVVQERHEGVDVVALEGVDVAVEELPRVVVDVQRRGRVELVHVEVDGVERRAGPLERAVDRRDRRVEQVGDLAGAPVQDVAQDEDRALARRQVLEGGHEGQPDRLARGGHVGRVALGRHDAAVGHREHPGALGHRGAQERVGGRGRREVHGPGAPLRAREHVVADVRGDAVQPRAQRRALLERVGGAPGADHGLLDRVLGLRAGAEHPVAVAGELPAVGLEVELEVVGRLGQHGRRW